MSRHLDIRKVATEECRYCGGNCPNEPADSKYLCDGFAGDIDGLYAEERKEIETFVA